MRTLTIISTLFLPIVFLACAKDPVAPPGGGGTATWKTVDSGSLEGLYGVHGRSGADIFVVGTGGTILHFDGTGWTPQVSGVLTPLRGVWAGSDTLVFAAGDAGIRRYNGTSWGSSLGIPDFEAVAGNSISDVYAVGDLGKAYRFDGTFWRYLDAGATRSLHAAVGTGSGEAYLAGDLSTLLRIDATGWKSAGGGETFVLAPADVRGIRKSGANPPILLGFLAIKAGTEDRVAMEFNVTELPPAFVSAELDMGLRNIDPGGAVGDMSIAYYYPGDGAIVAGEFSSIGNFYTTFTAAASSQFVHIDVEGLVNAAIGNPATYLGFVLYTTSTDRYDIDLGGGLPYPTLTVSTTVNPPDFNGVWAASANNVFTVGDGGTIRRYNGSSWFTMTSGTTNTLFSVWGSSSNNVFAVGAFGTILHYNGSTWVSQTSGTTESLHGVWGSSGSNVYAVGDLGTIVHYSQ